MAIMLMIIDHIGLFLMGDTFLLRAVGRLAFPMFVYLLLDGYKRTRNLKKYARRLILFWAISEVPYCIVFGYKLWEAQNIFLTLLACLATFVVMDRDYLSPYKKGILVVCLAISATMLHMEYGWYAIVLAVILYNYNAEEMALNMVLIMLAGTIYSAMDSNRFPIQLFAGLSVLFFPAQNEFVPSKRPPIAVSAMCYLFYPAHLIFLWLLTI